MVYRLGIALVALALAVPARAAPVKLGVINSMTGPESPIGENLTNGIKLALEDLKKKGVEVQVVWEDDTGKPQIGLSALEKLATRDNVAGVVGAYTSAVTSAVAKAAERYKVPLVNPVASKEEITSTGTSGSSACRRPRRNYAAILIDMALSLGKPKTMAILNETPTSGPPAEERPRLRREEGPQGGVRGGLLQGLSRLPLHARQAARHEPGRRVPRVIRGRRHPAHAAIA